MHSDFKILCYAKKKLFLNVYLPVSDFSMFNIVVYYQKPPDKILYFRYSLIYFKKFLNYFCLFFIYFSLLPLTLNW